MLSLEAVEYRGPGRWRWRLTDRGAFLADHEVRLDTSSWAYEAFVDLERCLRVDVDPERPLDSEREVIDLLAHWVGSEVFGEDVEAIEVSRLGGTESRAPDQVRHVTVRSRPPPGRMRIRP
ncbi:MAG: hypothetical protein ACRD0K_22800 [Egibacteraceae bacterium]